MKKLFGVITAMTTAYDDSGKVDPALMKNLTNFLIEKGVNCLYPCGTTGEMLLLSPEERELIAETVVKEAGDRVPVFVHVGAMTTAETVHLAQQAEKIGADGIGVITPSFFPVSERAILNFYKTISASVSACFPIYVYVIPQCSTNDISADLLQKIASECPNIIGVKYSGFDMVKVKNYTNVNGGEFSVVLGLDQLFLPALTMGCDGVVSGCSGAIPEPFVKVYTLWNEGKIKEAMLANREMAKLCEFLGNGSDMSIFKHVLNHRGINVGSMRAPLVDLTDEDWRERYQLLSPYLSNN